MSRAFKDNYPGKMLLKAFDDRLTIRIDYYLVDLRAGEQRADDVVKQWFSSQGAEILAWDALRMVSHGYKGGNCGHITSRENGFFRYIRIEWMIFP
jgi:hypothetical protein